ncbi:MAG: DUF29 domain-containing protein [Gomphosphaeria aponina SAG 52.96 = DSM 107014]|uniref:DUF29 domain-containing protein n=1 Tax=Gomphosphaeria aponina SAG 52.96 = DSM 107014 TaxID=1521640 RepID=A0A941GVU1_9CHRO|nr:DUF29 domain-containing protein [Gomphosphaeria aponina SAG 52.96 = DSM 107014]
MTTLYEQDFGLWLEQTINKIRAREFELVDWENLLEELEDLGKSEKRALVSNLVVLIAHLLKLQVQQDAPESMKKGWRDSVVEHRERVLIDLHKIPSLKSYLSEAIQEAYPSARKVAIKQGQGKAVGKPYVFEYPETCPFRIEEVLDEDFYG